MPATPRPTSSDQHHQYILILSDDALGAALLGGLVETLGYEVHFRRPPETPENCLRRLRPKICLVDCGDPISCREEFLARTAMRGVCVVIFGTREALDRVREMARTHRIETLLMPPTLNEVEATLQRAGGSEWT